MKNWLWLPALVGGVLIASILIVVLPSPGDDSKDKDVVKKDSGLEYIDLKLGAGTEAKKGNKVAVQYVGTLKANGTEFDSSRKHGGEPFVFELGAGRVIKGWEEGVLGMREGGKRKLIIPANLAYGNKPMGDMIPANSDLVFEVDLEKVEK
jgi:peptidylprolyl isomerase